MATPGRFLPGVVSFFGLAAALWVARPSREGGRVAQRKEAPPSGFPGMSSVPRKFGHPSRDSSDFCSGAIRSEMWH